MIYVKDLTDVISDYKVDWLVEVKVLKGYETMEVISAVVSEKEDGTKELLITLD